MKKLTNIKKIAITAIVALMVVAIFLNGGQLLAGPLDVPPGLDIAIQVQEAHTPDLMANRDVIGTAVGLNENGSPVIQVYATTNQVRGIPNRLEGIPVIVKVTDEFVARCPKGWCDRPVPIGVSTGHPDITAGTIGCRVKDASGNFYALSNNHIYANQNLADPGDNALQPGPYDGGIDPDDAIGTLADYEPIKCCSSPPAPSCPDNYIDAAIALSSTDDLGNSTLSNGYGKPRSTISSPTVNKRVKKYGRTTGLTKGKIYAINATVDVQYDTCVVRFKNQIIITPGRFSAGGDSGSLIVVNGGSDDRKPVGLLFAGSFYYTVANPISPVLSRFGVTVDGE
ncbi:MAG: hypothetical protein WBD99_12330 [Thermodesulfobacteriota bacterium]